jgi:hypothetical protein
MQQSGGEQSNIPPRSHLSRKQIFVAGGVVVGLIMIIAVLLAIIPLRGKRPPVSRPTNLGAELTRERQEKGAEEIGATAVYGEVISIQRGRISIQGLRTGKVYTVYVGRRTHYYPRRYPSIGEKIKVFYILDRGYMKATEVYIEP